MTDIQIQESGLFSLVADRTVEGLLIPYGEESRVSMSKTAPVKFAKGTVAIPRDPSIVTLNHEHDQFQPLGRATELRETDAGVVAKFAIANTDEGDAYLAEPSKKRLSAELTGLIRRGKDAVTARLTGAALTTEGAFASAALFALGDVIDEPVEDTTAPSPDKDNVLHVEATELPASVEVTAGEATQVFKPEDAPADDPATTESEDAAMTIATAPNTVEDTAVDKAKELGANAVFSALASVRNNGADSEQMLAALADIKHSGSGALPIAGVVQSDWIGEVWSGRAYARKFVTLGTQGVIRSPEAKGFRLDQGTALVKKWAGNKTELPTGTASTSIVTSVLEKFGFAADVAREFYDLPGGEEVIAAFWAGVAESYARETDDAARTHLLTAAGAPQAASAPVAGYPAALGMLIDGIEEIEDRNDTATFAILNAAAYREILRTPKDQIPHFVNFDVNTEHTGSANGGVTLVRGDVGIDDTPAVLVGSKAGIRFNELGTTPVSFDALNVAKYGVDKGYVGYLQTLVERPDSFVLIGTADA